MVHSVTWTWGSSFETVLSKSCQCLIINLSIGGLAIIVHKYLIKFRGLIKSLICLNEAITATVEAFASKYITLNGEKTG